MNPSAKKERRNAPTERFTRMRNTEKRPAATARIGKFFTSSTAAS